MIIYDLVKINVYKYEDWLLHIFKLPNIEEWVIFTYPGFIETYYTEDQYTLYNVFLEKGSVDFRSAVCVQRDR